MQKTVDDGLVFALGSLLVESLALLYFVLEGEQGSVQFHVDVKNLFLDCRLFY